jgi:hypothetical protein
MRLDAGQAEGNRGVEAAGYTDGRIYAMILLAASYRIYNYGHSFSAYSAQSGRAKQEVRNSPEDSGSGQSHNPGKQHCAHSRPIYRFVSD